MNKGKAIASKCLECSGGSPKEVTLCSIFDCPLWEWRFGYSMKSKRYRERMEKAIKNFPEEFKEFETIVKIASNSSYKLPIRAFFKKTQAGEG